MRVWQLKVWGVRSLFGAGNRRRRSRLADERGQALLETALTLPMVLLVAVGIFEFGRAYQTLQIVTNAAREGARVAIVPSGTPESARSRVRGYLQSSHLANAAQTTVLVDQKASVSIGTGSASATIVTVSYPFSFMVLNPLANLVVRGSTLGAPFSMTASAQMRNEGL